MPKRLIDDSLLNSPSMALLSPRAQDAFPRFILLADDFGCFEVHPRTLLARGWPDRMDVSEQELSGWLEEYAEKHQPGEPPMALVWTERGRRYCFLTGWFGGHGQRKRVEYMANGTEAERKGSKRRTPAPPVDLLAAAMTGNAPGNQVLPGGNTPGSASATNSEIINDSLPGREITGNATLPAAEIEVSRQKPAHAVPVAVAVPYADPVADAYTPLTPRTPEAAHAPAAALPAQPVSPGGERPTQLDAREARRPARLGVGSPAWEPWEHWSTKAWPKVANGAPEPLSAAQAQRLTELCGRHGPAEVCARMDRAAADEYWAGKLTLDIVLDRFERFAERKAGAGPPAGGKVTAAASKHTEFTGGRREL
jgi:hypothetical protein